MLASDRRSNYSPVRLWLYHNKLLDTEIQYDTGEQELLTIMKAMHH